MTGGSGPPPPGALPAPPKLSPDERFYWDGERWAPMPESIRLGLPRLLRPGL
jgi:hypothetical protein